MGINELYWPPFILYEDGEFSGMEIDAINLVFKEAKICAEFVIYPNSSRMLAEIKEGRVDVLVAATETADRKKYAYFSAPYRVEIMSVYAHKSVSETQFDIQALARKGMIFGINSGSYYGEMISQLKKRKMLKYINLPNAKKRFSLLDANRVDFVLEDVLSGNYMVSDNQYPNVVNTGVSVSVVPVSYILSRKTVGLEILSDINSSIEKNASEILDVFR
ncbi:substrate-binding periplasmic protein [Bowmanella denitrificans]|uniref:substrate-binding periplasmic protein n=1 Tax=Bowmanella denitrificans TaxID=366582 RepID=UPI001559DF01|nr:transporter substrate-binding domain-containing protein [Bowmanella denitrificans]